MLGRVIHGADGLIPLGTSKADLLGLRFRVFVFTVGVLIEPVFIVVFADGQVELEVYLAVAFVAETRRLVLFVVVLIVILIVVLVVLVVVLIVVLIVVLVVVLVVLLVVLLVVVLAVLLAEVLVVGWFAWTVELVLVGFIAGVL